MGESLTRAEVLLICVTAAALEGKPLSVARIAVLSNLLTGSNDTQNAVEMRMRDWRRQARELLSRANNEENVPCTPPAPKPRAKGSAKAGASKTGSRVLGGRVSKSTPRKTTKSKETVEDDNDDGEGDQSTEDVDDDMAI